MKKNERSFDCLSLRKRSNFRSFGYRIMSVSPFTGISGNVSISFCQNRQNDATMKTILPILAKW
nr:MAG TPA: hypothetical protein [Caudoviricetes sp.]